MNETKKSRGFTLVEVLMAFTILTISLGVLFQSAQAGLAMGARATTQGQAALVARSLLARVGVDLPLTLPKQEGKVTGTPFTWTVTITPHSPWQMRLRVPFDPVRVNIQIAWGDPSKGEAIELRTVRLRPQ